IIHIPRFGKLMLYKKQVIINIIYIGFGFKGRQIFYHILLSNLMQSDFSVPVYYSTLNNIGFFLYGVIRINYTVVGKELRNIQVILNTIYRNFILKKPVFKIIYIRRLNNILILNY